MALVGVCMEVYNQWFRHVLSTPIRQMIFQSGYIACSKCFYASKILDHLSTDLNNNHSRPLTIPTESLTEEGIDIITLSAGYDGDNFGGGIVYVDGDDYCGIVNSYISNGCTTLGVSSLEIDSVGIGGYWTPNEGKTTISATANMLQPDVGGIDIDDITDYQIAVEHEVFDGVLSASWKTIPLYNVVSSTDWNQDTLGTYLEVYYTHPVNDSLDLTYGVAMADPDTDSGDSFELYDYTAIGAQATFKF